MKQLYSHVSSSTETILQENVTLSFLDVETTGLSPSYNDRICEIAIVQGPLYGDTTPWQTLINPTRPISYGASMVNNITNEMVAEAPLFKDVALTIRNMLENTIVICHNAPFDLGFLAYEFEQAQVERPRCGVIDTLRIARKHFEFPSNNLGNIARCLGIKTHGAHRALADTLMTCEIFYYLLPQLQEKGIELNNIVTYE